MGDGNNGGCDIRTPGGMGGGPLIDNFVVARGGLGRYNSAGTPPGMIGSPALEPAGRGGRILKV